MLETELITRVMLFDPVNQCQGFCWDTKRKQFILATISGDNKTQDIFRISFDGSITINYHFNDRPRLGHMNTLTYRRDTDVIYTTNATIDGFLLTALDAKYLSVKEEIKMPYKVFNVAYDPFTHKFVSIRPYKKNIRLIQEYKCVANDNKPQFVREYELDCENEDINNNGAFVFLDNIIFTTLTHLVIYDTFNNVKTMVELPKNFEVEDIDIVDGQLYCSVYRPKGIVEIHRILGLDSQLTKNIRPIGF